MACLEGVIREELGRWGISAVERAVFGTAAPEEISRFLTSFCERETGASVTGGLFYRASAGCAAGVALDSGDRVVVKAYQPRWTGGFLTAVAEVQSHLARAGFPCAEPLSGPVPLSSYTAGLATLERYLADPGMTPLKGPVDRKAAANGLARQIQLSRHLDVQALKTHPLATASGGLYPAPHSPLFDFDATAAGAEWIDEMARQAAQLRASDSSAPLPAHTDWCARNIRVRDGRLIGAFDWDSLSLVPETTAVGQAAATWPVTSEPGGSVFPDANEVAAFATDYEAARGGTLTRLQRHAVAGAALWVLAYTARCEHALETTGQARSDQHGARDRLRADGPVLIRSL